MTTVALAGCGFLGSLWATEVARRWQALAPELRDELSLQLFDPDRVTERNVANQAFGVQDVGQNKADALGRALGGLSTLVNWAVYPDPMLRESWDLKPGLVPPPIPDLFVCAVDNVEARRGIWDLAVKQGVPLMVLGATQQGQGFVFWTDLERGIDTDPFSPTRMAVLDDAARQKIDKDVRQLPPCELTAMRGLGLNTALAGMRAFFRFIGLDVEAGEQEVGERRYSLWTATIGEHREVV